MYRVLGFALVLGLAIVTSAEAQQAGQVWRVAVLTNSPRSTPMIRALEDRQGPRPEDPAGG